MRGETGMMRGLAANPAPLITQALDCLEIPILDPAASTPVFETDELTRRPSRTPDPKAGSVALNALADALATADTAGLPAMPEAMAQGAMSIEPK